ncbi:SOS response-associated peptidase [soil metagenome]
MCGRFVSTSSAADLADHFGAVPPEGPGPEPRYNVAPTDDVLVVRGVEGARRVEAFHWGLVPWWAEDPKVGSRMINARAETLATKGAFKAAFAERRVLVPADGFYDWAALEGTKRKQAYFVHRPDAEPYAFAGLWEQWRGRDRDGSDHLRSTTIVTTAANGVMSAIHDRMPVVLPRSSWDEWLDPAHDDLAALGRLLVPAPDDLTVLRPVGPEVGNVRNDSPALVDEVVPQAPVDEPTLPGLDP